MKFFLPIALMFAILSQSMVNVGIEIYYHLNKQYITEKYCINKDKPMLHCNGHCYLTKELKEADEREQKSEAGIVKDILQVLIDQPGQETLTASCLPFRELCRLRTSVSLFLSPPVFEIYQPPKMN